MFNEPVINIGKFLIGIVFVVFMAFTSWVEVERLKIARHTEEKTEYIRSVFEGWVPNEDEEFLETNINGVWQRLDW